MAFHDTLVERHAGLWRRMLDHPFLLQARDGALTNETFNTWLRQDYLFVEAARPFLGCLVARGPERHRGPLGEALAALADELELFRERARALGVELGGEKPGLVNHAYVQFLLATGFRADYAEAFAVYYGAERAYHESWQVVREGLDPESPWQPFVENWAGDEFASFVAFLGEEVDRLAADASAEGRERMVRAFGTTVKYEIAFWEMALRGPGWFGIGALGGDG